MTFSTPVTHTGVIKPGSRPLDAPPAMVSPTPSLAHLAPS
jgi:hypothetical protein